MSSEARRAAVAALGRLAESPDYHDRADAGRSLASFAEMPEAREPLLALVLDARDTFVTRATAIALLQRHDSAGLAIVASALATGDLNTADWIYSAVCDVFMVYVRDRDAAARECEELARDPDERVHCGAVQLTAMLAEINPILCPAQNEQLAERTVRLRTRDEITRLCEGFALLDPCPGLDTPMAARLPRRRP